MRKAGFYWVKYKDRRIVAECVQRWPTISDGSYYIRWLIPGGKKERKDEDFEEIDERPIIGNKNTELLTVEYLLGVHPELTHDLAEDLLKFSRTQTICRKECYADGCIIFPLWKAQLPK